MFKTVRQKQKGFYKIWLAAGIAQALVSAIGGFSAGESLLSEAPAEAATRRSASTDIPVRISRALFEKELLANIQLTEMQPSQARTSAVRWNENAETVPASVEPGATPIMVNDDHIGCAEFSELSPMRLCFKIQADVDSVALKTDQVWLEGIAAVARPSCIQVLDLVSAERSGQGFSVSFQIVPKDTSECTGQGGLVQASVSQI